MMTPQQRHSFIESLEKIIESKKGDLENLKRDEGLLQEFTQNQTNGAVALHSYKTLLAPQRKAIDDLQENISRMEKQLVKLHDPAIESMSDDDAIKHINS